MKILILEEGESISPLVETLRNDLMEGGYNVVYCNKGTYSLSSMRHLVEHQKDRGVPFDVIICLLDPVGTLFQDHPTSVVLQHSPAMCKLEGDVAKVIVEEIKQQVDMVLLGFILEVIPTPELVTNIQMWNTGIIYFTWERESWRVKAGPSVQLGQGESQVLYVDASSATLLQTLLENHKKERCGI